MSESEPIPTNAPSRRRFRQISLRTLLLLTAAVAVWVAHLKNRHDNQILAKQIEAMWPLAHELVIEDPSQIAVVKQDERWYDQNDWKVYLPEGNYRLCVATREITENGSPPATKSTPLSAGTYHLAIKQKRDESKDWRVSIAVDGEEVLGVQEPAAWDAGHGSSGGGQYSSCTQFPPDQPVVLFRRRFTVETAPGSYSTPQGPTNGILLWIERAGQPTGQ